jgi:hypothetical protein
VQNGLGHKFVKNEDVVLLLEEIGKTIHDVMLKQLAFCD